MAIDIPTGAAGPKTIDFSAGYRSATNGSTLKALQQRRADIQGQMEAAMKPREVASMWQGGAQLADVISGGIREGRAANQEAAGRARFAQLLAGGLAPDEIGEAMGLDPETAMKYQQNQWDVDAATQRIEAEKQAQLDRFAHDDATLTKTQDFTARQTEDQQTHAVELQKQSQEAQRVLQDARATDEQKQEAQRVIDEAKVAALKVETDKTAADQAAERASEQSMQTAAQNSEIGRIKMGMRPGPNGEPPLIDEATGNAQIAAIIKETQKKSVPPGLDEMNRKVADELTKWVNGGQTTIASNLSNITKAIEGLKPQGTMDEINNKIGMGKTGPLASLIPESWTSVLNPEGTKARDAIRTSVQSSLTQVLGGQFAQAEGEQMLKRAFDMSMSPTENIDRANRIMAQLKLAAKAKDDLAKYYFDNNYSVEGYQGPTMDQIQADFEAKINAELDATDSGAAAPAAEPDISTVSEDELKRIAGGTP